MTGWERWSTGKWENGHANKPESVQENMMLKILCDFKLEMNHQILAKRPNLVLINKKIIYRLMNCHSSELLRGK